MQHLELNMLKNYLGNQKYKATLILTKAQISLLFQVVSVFIFRYIMSYSYELGYFIAATSLLIILLGIYPFIKIKEK